MACNCSLPSVFLLQIIICNLLPLKFIHLLLKVIHSGYFYSTYLNSPLLRSATDNLPKGRFVRRKRDSNPRPFGRKAPNLPLSHHAPHSYFQIISNMYRILENYSQCAMQVLVIRGTKQPLATMITMALTSTLLLPLE